MAWATSSVMPFAASIASTWRWAPWATSPTAFAISPTARPASSEVDAISWEDADSELAAWLTWPKSR